MWRGEGGSISGVEINESPLYENESKFVTVKLYHGGKYVKDPLLRNKGGEFDMFDFVNGDESVLDLNHYTERLGYCGPHKLYYCIGNKSMDEGLGYMEANSDVRDMVDALDEYMKIVEVFRVATHDYDPLKNSLVHCDTGCDECDDDDDTSDPEKVDDSDYKDSDNDDRLYDRHVDDEVQARGWTLHTTRKHDELPKVDTNNGMEASSVTDVQVSSVFEQIV